MMLFPAYRRALAHMGDWLAAQDILRLTRAAEFYNRARIEERETRLHSAQAYQNELNRKQIVAEAQKAIIDGQRRIFDAYVDKLEIERARSERLATWLYLSLGVLLVLGEYVVLTTITG